MHENSISKNTILHLSDQQRFKKKKKFWQHSMFAMVGGERHPPAMLAGVQTDSTLVEAIW